MADNLKVFNAGQKVKIHFLSKGKLKYDFNSEDLDQICQLANQLFEYNKKPASSFEAIFYSESGVFGLFKSHKYHLVIRNEQDKKDERDLYGARQSYAEKFFKGSIPGNLNVMGTIPKVTVTCDTSKKTVSCHLPDEVEVYGPFTYSNECYRLRRELDQLKADLQWIRAKEFEIEHAEQLAPLPVSKKNFLIIGRPSMHRRWLLSLLLPFTFIVTNLPLN